MTKYPEEITQYADLIKVLKCIRGQADTALLLPNNVIALHNELGCRNFCKVDSDIDYSRFLYAVIPIEEACKSSSNFKRTKSSISFKVDEEMQQVCVSVNFNTEEYTEPFKFYLMENQSSRGNILATFYSGLLEKSDDISSLFYEADEGYIEISDELLDALKAKKLIELQTNEGNVFLVARPIFINVTKSDSMSFKTYEDNIDSFIVKFKQKIKGNTIYTFAKFMKY